jgi:hypothetical protein
MEMTRSSEKSVAFTFEHIISQKNDFHQHCFMNLKSYQENILTEEFI